MRHLHLRTFIITAVYFQAKNGRIVSQRMSRWLNISVPSNFRTSGKNLDFKVHRQRTENGSLFGRQNQNQFWFSTKMFQQFAISVLFAPNIQLWWKVHAPKTRNNKIAKEDAVETPTFDAAEREQMQCHGRSVHSWYTAGWVIQMIQLSMNQQLSKNAVNNNWTKL